LFIAVTVKRGLVAVFYKNEVAYFPQAWGIDLRGLTGKQDGGF